jgi:SAM-dependent methyltransferase
MAAVLPLHRRVFNRARLALRPPDDDAAHYVRDYRRMVRRLMADHPIDEAMSLAVGGDYDAVGPGLAELLRAEGLADGTSLLDLGCGSGRLAHALGSRVRIGYLGLDVVPELLAYARTRCPPDYQFEVNTGLSLPAADASFDMACAFSVFTHLQHEETFSYLEELARVLKPGGRLVFSFLEFADAGHWRVFAETVAAVKEARRSHLNVFIERPVIALWAERTGFAVEGFIDGAGVSTQSVGQAIAILRR